MIKLTTFRRAARAAHRTYQGAITETGNIRLMSEGPLPELIQVARIVVGETVFWKAHLLGAWVKPSKRIFRTPEAAVRQFGPGAVEAVRKLPWKERAS